MVDENEIADDNDYVGIVGPIKGMDPDTGLLDLYHGTDLVVFVADDPESNTPIGTLTSPCVELGTTARFPFAFPGGAITTSCAALADGTKVYRVVRAPSNKNIRVWRELTYRKTRESRI